MSTSELAYSGARKSDRESLYFGSGLAHGDAISRCRSYLSSPSPKHELSMFLTDLKGCHQI